MDKKLKEIENLIKQQKPSDLDTEFKRKIELIFSEKLGHPESLNKQNKIINFPLHQRIATAAAIVIAAIGSLFAFLNDSNRQDINSASTPITGQPENGEADKFIPIESIIIAISSKLLKCPDTKTTFLFFFLISSRISIP